MNILLAIILCFSVCILCAYWENKIHKQREINNITKDVIRQIKKHANYDNRQVA